MPARGCMMCHSLYVKANGEMPCWDDIGETLTLRTLEESALCENRESPIFYGAELQNIRQSFLRGNDPHSGFCELCGVRGHGGVEVTLNPRVMEVLNLEASYLCHLSCPQCIPAHQRGSLKGPPYNMRPAFLDGLLRQLRCEGVDHVRFIHFEGRGDPLLNPKLPELIDLSRHYFPKSLVGVTTHASYRYMPWIVTSKLDLLRASIDGATRDSYSKYRVGGNFERAMEFLAQLRDDRIRTQSVLRVEWKYILFEWNDSDAEMQLAADLARKLQVHLTFVRTHTPGRSMRFQSDAQLQDHVRRFSPDCAVEPTFQSRSEHHTAAPSAVLAEQVASLLSLAAQSIRRGDEPHAIAALAEALKYDPGLSVARDAAIGEIIEQNLSALLSDCQFPSTLTWLAAVSREIGNRAAANAFLSRYLELVPDAPDRNHILCDRYLEAAVQHAGRNEFESAHDALRHAMHYELGMGPPAATPANPIDSYMPRLLATDCSPSLVAGFASVANAEKRFPAARALFYRYLEISPETPEREKVRAIIADLDKEIRRSAVLPPLWDRAINRLRRLVS